MTDINALVTELRRRGSFPYDLRADLLIESADALAIQQAVNAQLLEALNSMLNVEGATRVGCECAAFEGLDWKYHFDKARDAIKAAKSVL